ncbi:hypothetical protein QLX08_003235 [Tetragonisca angustula]|uniref:Uncharacterized protein n=1 Tax=Tetragonisca angustula TaxID=166442 RepID=A0AAW1A7C8_9HYME
MLSKNFGRGVRHITPPGIRAINTFLAEFTGFQISSVRAYTFHEPRDINMASSRRVIVEFVLIANGEACLSSRVFVCAELAEERDELCGGTSYYLLIRRLASAAPSEGV